MDLNLFGYKLSKDNPQNEDNYDTFAPSKEQDGAIQLEDYTIDYVSNTKHIFDFEGHFDNEEQRINEYRKVSRGVEADYAITDIVNESVVQDKFDDAVDLNLDSTNFSDPIRKKINEEWNTVSNLFDLNTNISMIFKQWYVDGKIYYHKIVDSTKQKEGIIEVRFLDPRRIKKVREVRKNDTAAGDRIDSQLEYYIYSFKPIRKDGIVGAGSMTTDNHYTPYGSNTTSALQISTDMIAYAHSGLIVDDVVLSYIHKALKPLNQLNLIEDAIVIYRLSRAPERRVFYVDVGNLNKTRGEQYMKSLISQYRNKFTYDTSTGRTNTKKNQLSMMEDIWLPRREGSRGTEVDTLDGGQNLGELEDLQYFKNKAFRALNVPISRLDSETTFNIGRSSEITRDEVRFSKFADLLRINFSKMFLDVLRTQLLLKRIITEDDWEKERNAVKLIYNTDSYYDELKDQELLSSRIEILQNINDFVGKYYSVEWVRKHVLMQDEDDIKEIDEQIEEEKDKYTEEEEDDSFGGGGYDEDPKGSENAGKTPGAEDAEEVTQEPEEEEKPAPKQKEKK